MKVTKGRRHHPCELAYIVEAVIRTSRPPPGLGVGLGRGAQAVRLGRIRHLHGWPPSKRLTHLVAVLRSVARAAHDTL